MTDEYIRERRAGIAAIPQHPALNEMVQVVLDNTIGDTRRQLLLLITEVDGALRTETYDHHTWYEIGMAGERARASVMAEFVKTLCER